MQALHRFIDFLGGTTVHVDWFVLCSCVLLGAVAAGAVVRRW